MSRPELYVINPDLEPVGTMGTSKIYLPATPADLIAAVRRGVESGTIKGEVVEALYQLGDAGKFVWRAELPGPGTYIVIGPVSDGGSETDEDDLVREAVEELINKPLREGPVDGGFRPGAEVDSMGEVSDGGSET